MLYLKLPIKLFLIALTVQSRLNRSTPKKIVSIFIIEYIVNFLKTGNCGN